MDKSKVIQDLSKLTPRFGGYLKFQKDLPPNPQLKCGTRKLIDSKTVAYIPQATDDWTLDKDTREVLTSVIACVMQMARKKLNVSNKDFEMVEKYLNSVKDNTKENLPNITGILKHMSAIKTTPKMSNQIGDYTYAYKHNNDVYCALGEKSRSRIIRNFVQPKRSGRYAPIEKSYNYASELEMILNNSLAKIP